MASQDHTNISAIARASNTFAFNLYKELCKTEGDNNLFFSPLSITAALAMVHLGTAGNTADEIKTALNAKDLKDEDFHGAFSALTQKLNTEEQSACALRLANRVFVRKNFDIKESFTKASRKHYAAEAQVLDFANDTEKSRKTINKWVEDQTEEKIKDLLQPGIIDTDTAMVLANAIYFKGQWLKQFDPECTHKENWTLISEEETLVDLMSKDDHYKFSESEEMPGTLYADFPYKGDEMSMGIILPGSVGELGQLRQHMNVNFYEKLVSSAFEDNLMVLIPKFKIESQANLKDLLKSLGIKEAFEHGKADFTNIADSPDMYLSEVVHKAFVEVNEEGTEAAAATADIEIECMAAAAMEFRATHPFVFVIKDNVSGAIIFMGHLMNPNT